jgi:ferredoxin
VFEIGDRGIARLLQEEADPALLREAARSCPSGAIKVAGDE